MAQASTRQGLIDYALRQNGAPVLEINIEDDQIDDLVDDAIQFYNCLLYTSPSPRDS